MNQQERKWFKELQDSKRDHAKVFMLPEYKDGIWEQAVEKYSDPAHFLYELLQNADDTMATSAEVQLTKEGLLFKHNGKVHFTVSSPDPDNYVSDRAKGKLGHLNSITSLGYSSKKSDEVVNKIGKFGIGFKAVFKYTNTPEIYDDNVCFRIVKYIIPEEITTDHPWRKAGETLFYLPFDRKEVSAKKAYKDIEGKLKDLLFPTLFLRHLKSLKWTIGTLSGTYTQEEQLVSEGDCCVKKVQLKSYASGRPTCIDHLVLVSKDLPERGLSYSVGFFIDPQTNVLMARSVPAFCYFPTKLDTGLNFLIHAPFKLTDSREGILDDEWNTKLYYLLSILAANSLPILCKMNLITADNIFYIVPYVWSEKTDMFYSEFVKVLKTKQVLPCYGGGYTTAEHAYWPSSQSIPKFLPQRQLRELTGDSAAKWVFVRLNYKNLQLTNKELSEFLDKIIKDVTYDFSKSGSAHHRLDESAIFTRMNSDFVESQPLEWLHEFYKYLLHTKSAWDEVKSKEIFLDVNHKAVAAQKYDRHTRKWERTLFIDTIAGSTLPTVLPELLENATTREFISQFGIGKPNLRDEIFNDIIPQYERDESIDTEPHFAKFFEYFRLCPASELDDYIQMISNCEFIWAYDATVTEPTDDDIYRFSAVKDDLFFPSPSLRSYFKDYDGEFYFVDIKDYEKMCSGEGEKHLLYDFLERLGVKKTLPVVERDWYSAQPIGYADYVEREYGIVRSMRKLYDRRIPHLESHLRSMDEGSSLAVWNALLFHIAQGNNTFSKLMALHGSYETFPSTLMWDIQNRKWLYKSNGELCSPYELSKSELRAMYDTHCAEAKVLCDFLQFKGTRPTSIDDALQLARQNMSDDEIIKTLYEANAKKVTEINDNDVSPGPVFNPDYEIKHQEVDVDDVDQTDDDEGDDPQDIQYDFDPDKLAEDLAEKMKAETETKNTRKELVTKLNESVRYSYDWFCSYISLLSTYSQKMTQDKVASISFSSMHPDANSNRFFLLGGADRFIPEDISEAEGIQLNLIFEDGNSEVVEVDGISRLGQEIQILTAHALSDERIKRLSRLFRAEIHYTPVINLLQRLQNVFCNPLYVSPWTDIAESLPAVDYIYGPPGTGKTFTIAQKISDITLDNKARILVLTPTNTAADEVCRKLHNEHSSVRFARLSSVTDLDLDAHCKCYFDTLSVADIGVLDVVASTIHRLPYYNLQGTDELSGCKLFEYPWDYIIFDEASMIGLHYIVFALMAISKKSADTRFIVAGDPMQIPPVVEVDDDELEHFDVQDENIYTMMGISGFENAESQVRYGDTMERLMTQYRSVGKIGDLYSDLSYNSLLGHARDFSSDKALPGNFCNLFEEAVSFVDIPMVKTVEAYRVHKLNGSSYHFYSALMVMEILKRFDEENLKDEAVDWTIGLISPYKAQALLMDKLAKSYNFSSHLKITSDTVHGFQGGECDIVFFVNNPNSHASTPPKGKYRDRCMLYKQYIYNVAISRARDYLIILHPFSWMKKNPYINRIVSSYKWHNRDALYIPYRELEMKLFSQVDYIKDNCFVTSHDNVNVYNDTIGKKYIMKYGEKALDIQVFNNRTDNPPAEDTQLDLME